VSPRRKLSKGRWDEMPLRYGYQLDHVMFFNMWERTGRRKKLTPQRVWRKWHVSECLEYADIECNITEELRGVVRYVKDRIEQVSPDYVRAKVSV
jgi:hypothetical protein